MGAARVNRYRFRNGSDIQFPYSHFESKTKIRTFISYLKRRVCGKLAYWVVHEGSPSWTAVF
jgi:hypothetical protein